MTADIARATTCAAYDNDRKGRGEPGAELRRERHMNLPMV